MNRPCRIGTADRAADRVPRGARGKQRRHEDDQQHRERDAPPGHGRERMAHDLPDGCTERRDGAVTAAARPGAAASEPTMSPIDPRQADDDDHLRDITHDSDDDGGRDVERIRQLAIGHDDEPDRAPRERDPERHVRDQPGDEDPSGLEPANEREVEPPTSTLRGSRATHQPGHARRHPRHARRSGPPRLRGARRASPRPTARRRRRPRARPRRGRWPSRPARTRSSLSAGATTFADADRRRQHDDRQQRRATMPPRTRKAARASGQVAGVGERDQQRARQRRPAASRRGAGRRSRRWARASPGASDLESLERRLDERDLRAVAGEVAVAERRLGELEVGVGVVDQARHVGRQARRPARRSASRTGRRAMARDVADGAGRSGVGDGRRRAAGLGRQQQPQRVAERVAPRRPGAARRRRSA